MLWVPLPFECRRRLSKTLPYAEATNVTEDEEGRGGADEQSRLNGVMSDGNRLELTPPSYSVEKEQLSKKLQSHAPRFKVEFH